MKIPFFSRKEEDIASIAARATYVPSHEMAWPLRTPITHEEARELARRVRERRIRLGLLPPK
jgi:hypothetical protein